MEGNGLDYMSVEFHYYTPWDYAGECKFNFWGEPYKDKGEWGVTDRQKGGQTEHFGIFDRKAGMKVKADWILKGIFE